MILIAHRGNIDGPNYELENEPNYILFALQQGFDVECDVWFKNNQFFLGHDEPKYVIPLSFLCNYRIWSHAKSIETLHLLLYNVNRGVTCFFHDKDDCTLTSNNFIWTYPGKPLTPFSIAVKPKRGTKVDCAGVCSDYVKELQ
jgi:hypothetical protein